MPTYSRRTEPKVPSTVDCVGPRPGPGPSALENRPVACRSSLASAERSALFARRLPEPSAPPAKDAFRAPVDERPDRSKAHEDRRRRWQWTHRVEAHDELARAGPGGGERVARHRRELFDGPRISRSTPKCGCP